MPRGDGTGPMGLGSMTGRAAGYCAGYNTPGYMNPIYGGGFAGRGRGFYGRGGGRGFRNRFYATGLYGWQRASMGVPFGVAQGGPAYGGYYPYAGEVTPKQEADILKNEADVLKSQLNDIQSRIDSLEKNQSNENE
jgi:hypothetical protein